MCRIRSLSLSTALVVALACGGRVTRDGDSTGDVGVVPAPTGGLIETGGLAAGGASGGQRSTGGDSGSSAASGGSPVTGGTAPTSGAGGDSGGSAPGGGALATGGLAIGGHSPLGTGGRDPEPRECGPLIDDMEDASGHVCDDGVRRGVWYTFNDAGAEQWPAPQTPGVPIPVAEIPGGRGESLRAMHTYGGSFTAWGAGLGVDLAFDGVTYALYDASAYDGITFWVRGDRGHSFEVRMSDEETTHVDYGGTCESEPCVRCTREVAYDAEWTEVWIPFASLYGYGKDLLPSRLVNLQFFVRDNPPFDFWIDDLSFYSGAPDCGDNRPPECQGVLPIADPTLAATLGQPSVADTCDVTRLEIAPDDALEAVASLDGLHCYGALASLSVPGQALTEVDELSQMPQLSAVVLADNALTNLDGLASTGYLDWLDVSGNRLESLGTLGGVTGLTVLRAAGNLLTDAVGLEAQGALVELDLADNQLTSVAALPPLPALTRLSLASNSIEDVGVLEAATSLYDVDLSDNLVTDVTPLGGARSLTFLDLDSNRITSIDGLANLTALYRLDLGENELTSLDPVATLTGLVELYFAGNHVTDLAPLAALPYLQRVSLANNQVEDLSPLSGLGLISLDASHNLVETIPAFAQTTLGELILDGNRIADLGPLATKTTFTTLSLDDNPVSDLTPLGSIQYIVTLNLRHTAITTLAPLAQNPAIHDYSSGWASFHPAIHVEENPQLDCAAEAENIAALRARSVDVFTDCPVE
ncbi:MAG TPA: leucine-rich repeat domain-containing protein [Polyangiaceae bacterium]|nr:leucine-rich repeat domain-containing protein [Polyangiaceae bacterium]